MSVKQVRKAIAKVFSIVFLSAAAAVQANGPAPGNYAIDASHTSVVFAVDHMGYSDVVGRFNELEGNVQVGSSGEATINMVIKVGSIDSNHAKRDEHLRSPDFFNARQFPEIKITGPLSFKRLNGKSELVAKVTLLGITKNVHFELEEGKQGKDPWGLERVGYTAIGTLKRSDFGMNFMQGGIGDEVLLTVNLEAIKQ
ncbi:YceI family protein [Saccharophagus degradans]|uniref:YceI family protein n=1 Tax=Saccharophagus degradans TaxID=86304 RepID=UPI001C098E8A|nr:YceI family protein [Saccharophagus degradans]MBU2985320.1 YceI family protein [Saccharophagus degradans]